MNEEKKNPYLDSKYLFLYQQINVVLAPHKFNFSFPQRPLQKTTVDQNAEKRSCGLN